MVLYTGAYAEKKVKMKWGIADTTHFEATIGKSSHILH